MAWHGSTELAEVRHLDGAAGRPDRPSPHDAECSSNYIECRFPSGDLINTFGSIIVRQVDATTKNRSGSSPQAASGRAFAMALSRIDTSVARTDAGGGLSQSARAGRKSFVASGFSLWAASGTPTTPTGLLLTMPSAYRYTRYCGARLVFISADRAVLSAMSVFGLSERATP